MNMRAYLYCQNRRPREDDGHITHMTRDNLIGQVRDRWFKPHSGQVSSRSRVEIEYCGEPPCSRGSVIGLKPPGIKFRIMCLEGSVISFIPQSSKCSPGPV